MDLKIISIIVLSLIIIYDRKYIGPCLSSCYQKYDNAFLIFVFIIGILIGYYISNSKTSDKA